MPPTARWFAAPLVCLAVCVVAPATADAPDAPDGHDLSRTFREAARSAGETVVAIHAVEPVGAPAQRRERGGQGSGVLVSADGYVLTNNHVVSRAARVQVRMTDGREFEGRVVGADAKTDLAVLKIEAEGLPHARLADSDDVEVGDWVLAIGNPFGLGHSVSAGIISARGRSGINVADYEDFLQTDAAINPGNSGGPLVNLRGEVVGINTAITTRTGGSMGIGFAIPSNLARVVLEDLVSEGRVVRGYLGVVLRNLSIGLAQELGHTSIRGALVAEVDDGSPADRAGLRVNDIVVAVGGRPVHSMQQLRTSIAATRPGVEVTLGVVRAGERLDVVVTLEELEPQVTFLGDERIGLEVASLTPERAAEAGADPGAPGVVVTGVDPAGLAWARGVRVGDVITAVDGAEVRTIRDFAAADGALELSLGVRLRILTPDGKRKLVTLRR